MDEIQCRGREGPPFRIVVEVLEPKGWFHMKAWQNSWGIAWPDFWLFTLGATLAQNSKIIKNGGILSCPKEFMTDWKYIQNCGFYYEKTAKSWFFHLLILDFWRFSQNVSNAILNSQMPPFLMIFHFWSQKGLPAKNQKSGHNIGTSWILLSFHMKPIFWL